MPDARGLSETVRDDLDRITRIRRLVLPTVHRIAEPLGGFAQCVMNPTEYVGTVKRKLGDLRSDLRSMGFRREPISSLKQRDDGAPSIGSWVWRASVWAKRQLHVTLFWNPDHGVEIWAHWEYSWIRHPLKHYRCAAYDPLGGVKSMRRLLTAKNIPYVVVK
ncbi:hypothetical protein ACNS7O_17040 (plasmid) [Haloferacaceae archaeon DSL9]